MSSAKALGEFLGEELLFGLVFKEKEEGKEEDEDEEEEGGAVDGVVGELTEFELMAS